MAEAAETTINASSDGSSNASKLTFLIMRLQSGIHYYYLQYLRGQFKALLR